MGFGWLSRGIRLGSGLAGRRARLFGRSERAGYESRRAYIRAGEGACAVGGDSDYYAGRGGEVDTDFDGADEVDSRLNTIKGYGGALVREKIVAASSRRLVVLVGYKKIVKRLGDRGVSRSRWCRSVCGWSARRSRRWG